MLAPSGRLMGDLTTMRIAEDKFLVGGSGYLQTWHMRWLTSHLAEEGVSVRNVSDEYAGIALFGPRSRALLGHIARYDVSNDALPFMGVRATDIGFAPAFLARLSVTGELGYEIYTPAPYLNSLQRDAPDVHRSSVRQVLQTATDQKIAARTLFPCSSAWQIFSSLSLWVRITTRSRHAVDAISGNPES